MRAVTRSLAALAMLAGSLGLAACGGAPKPPPPPPAAALGLRESFEPAPEFGGAVHVLEAGPPDAPALVLIHGFGSRAARDFDPIIAALSEHRHVFTFDLPGFGSSSHDDQLYTPARYVSFLRDFLARHFDKPVDLLGHSMGGTLALSYAGHYPNRVARLALLDVAGIIYYRDYMLNLAESDGSADGVLDELWSEARESLLRVALSVSSLEELHLEHREQLPSYLSPTAAAALMLMGHDFSRELHRISTPTWLGWGADDDIAPQRTAEVLRFMLKPVHVEIFSESGHVPMQTEPEQLARSLLEFLSRPRQEHHQAAAQPQRSARSWTSTRTGSCVNQRDRLFEGAYDRIVVHNCKRVSLRDVRTHELWIEDSSVELLRVEIDSQGTGAIFASSRVRWTGGQVTAAVCIESDASRLDFAGVSCQASKQTLRIREPGPLLASVSWFEGPQGVRRMHGKYALESSLDGHTPTLSSAELAQWMQRPSHSQPRFEVESWAGKRLNGENLVGAALSGINFEGTNLTGADLSAADLRGARLRRSRLRNAKLTGADLRQADVTNAHIEGSDLRFADLRGTNLAESNLSAADLRAAKLEGAKLRGARLRGAVYDARTTFSADFEPSRHGLVLQSAPEQASQRASGGSAHSLP